MDISDESIPLTRLLTRSREGGKAAKAAELEIVNRVYPEMRKLAAAFLRGEPSGHTLQATALANEAYLRIFQGEGVPGENRAHFFAIVSKRVREVLIDHARKKRAGKRWGRQVKVPLDEIVEPARDDYDWADIARGLEQLELSYPKAAQVIELKYIAGLSTEDIAEAMKLTTDAVRRLTTKGRRRLRDILEPAP